MEQEITDYVQEWAEFSIRHWEKERTRKKEMHSSCHEYITLYDILMFTALFADVFMFFFFGSNTVSVFIKK